jgi:hypothetical protein
MNLEQRVKKLEEQVKKLLHVLSDEYPIIEEDFREDERLKGQWKETAQNYFDVPISR